MIPILSFFTGAGLMDIGFARAGLVPIWHNEIEPWFIRGFEMGMSSLGADPVQATIQNRDSIVDVTPERILDEAFGGTAPDIFGVIGGPPCPDFSVGGKNRGREGDRGRLSLTFVQRILSLRPTIFVFENVPGLMSNTKHHRFITELRSMLEADYAVDWRILNALDSGVPQDRERVFMIGFRRDQVPRPTGGFQWPNDPRYIGAKKRYDWPKRGPFGGDPPRPEDIPLELMVGPLICDPALADLPNAEGFVPHSARFTEVEEGDDSKKSFKRLHRWRYSPTAAYGNNEVHLHPTQPRRLTVREAMRIQTIPDGYVLPAEMPLSSKYKAVANGIPVGLAEALARSIREFVGDLQAQ